MRPPRRRGAPPAWGEARGTVPGPSPWTTSLPGPGHFPVCAEKRAAGDRASRSGQPTVKRNSSRSALIVLGYPFRQGITREFHPVVQLQLVQGVLDVVLHVAVRKGQPGRDCLLDRPVATSRSTCVSRSVRRGDAAG